MNANPVFLAQVARIKKVVLLKTLHRAVLCALVVFLGLYTLAAGLAKFGGPQFNSEMAFYLLAALCAGGCALGYAYFTTEPLNHTLIALDTRLNLQDRISTAYEYAAANKTSEFGGLLIADAGSRLNGLSVRQLCPRQFLKGYLWLGGLIALNLGLVFMDRLPFTTSPQTPLDPERAQAVSTLLKQHPTPKPEEPKNPTPAEKRTQDLYTKLDQLARKLAEQKVTREELVKALRQNLQEVQGEKKRLAQDLEHKLSNMETLANLNMQNTLQPDRLTANDLRKLRDMLNQALDRQIPDNLRQNLDRLSEQQQVSELLQQALDNAEANDSAASAPDRGEKQPGSESAQNRENAENVANPQENPATADAPKGLGNEERANSTSGEANSAGTQARGGEETSEQQALPGNETDEGTSAPGQAKSTAPKQAPHELEKLSGPGLKDKIQSVAADEARIQIRSVTEIGKAALPSAEVTRPYRQELETVLHKEDIPANYREYIKNYFISIGLEPPGAENTEKKE
jgi:hypothetical protein